MKASRYNRIFEAADGTWLAFNGWSTALAALDPDDLPFVRAILADPDGTPCDTPHKRQLREALVSASFLVEDAVDELAEFKAGMMRDRFRTDALYLTIAPTTDCNFRCDYCYEERLKVTMSRAVQEALGAFVAARAPALRQIDVTWFGGEPLMPRALDVIRALSGRFLAIAAERGLAYRAQLVTNGYLLGRPLMEELAGLGVKQVQVTLDGPPEVHDRRRVLAGGQGTFWRIVENLKQSVDLAAFQVRINVDRRNAEDALEVVRLLREAGLEKVPVYVAQVTSGAGRCGNIDEDCFHTAEFAATELSLYRLAAERGLRLSRYPYRRSGAFCTADRAGGFVVGPGGALFKCWYQATAEAGESVGHLLDPQQPWQRMNEHRWLAWDPFGRRECPECAVLPLCQGGCPAEALAHPERPRGACEHYRYHLEPLLELRHVYRLPMAPAPAARGGAGVTP